MGWIKLDDNFFSNRKIIGLSKESKLLHLAALCYAGANLSDGVIPLGALRMIAAQASVTAPQKLISELKKAGLWVEHPTGYEIHDYLKHNTSLAEVEAKREAARKRMEEKRRREQEKKFAGSSQEVRANNERSSQDVRHPETETETETEINSIGASAPKPKKRSTQVPKDFALTDALTEWGAKEGFTVEQMRGQIPQFIDHWTGKGETRKDWVASFRTWMRNARTYGHLNRSPGSLSILPTGQPSPYAGRGYDPLRSMTPEEAEEYERQFAAAKAKALEMERRGA